MHLDNSNDNIWDEYQWENHINEIEEKSDQLKEFINSTWGEGTPSWLRFLNEYSSELEAIDAYIEEELLFEEAYFPDDDDEDFESDEDDMDDDLFFGQDDSETFDDFDEDDDLFDEDDDDDFLEGEEWKNDSEEYVMSDYGSIDNLRIYNEARNLGAHLLKYVDKKPGYIQNTAFVQFVTEVLQISCKLAAGYSFGFDKDVLGANITYTKKALLYSNRSLTLLQAMRNKNTFRRDEYYRMHEWLFEIRNDIGVYIQDMREQFYSGF